MNLFQVLYDGPSRPIIQTPTGRWLSLSEFNNGKWDSYEREDKDCHAIVDALNWLMVHAPKQVEVQRIEGEL